MQTGNTGASNRQNFHLHTFEEDINTKALPLSFQGYTHSLSRAGKPNPNLLCDGENCSETSLQTEVFRLACQHTYHEQCHIRNGRKCPRCTKILKSKLSQLTKPFNKSILTPTTSARNERQQSAQDGNDDDSDVRITNSKVSCLL